MFKFYTSRKPAYLNFAILLLFLASWLLSYMMPVLKGLVQEDMTFFGTVSHASIPSIFGGSDIPFFDKTYFQLNGDDNAKFVLYASKDIMDEMSDWFSFAAVNAGDVPLEVTAARVSDNVFVVHSLNSTYGSLDFEELVMDYQVYYAFIGCIIIGVMVIAAIVLLIMWLVRKRRI